MFHNGTVISVPSATNGQAKSNGQVKVKEPAKAKEACACACPCDGEKKAAASNGEVDFAKMTAAQKVAYHRAKWDRILG